MLRTRVASLVTKSPSLQASSFSSSPSTTSAAKVSNEEKGRSFGRKAVSTALLCLTGGVALSAIDDLAVYQGCSSKAMEKATTNPEIIKAIGEPVSKGSWYNASLSVAHKRNTVSCTFPVSGPQGNGVLRLKAVRNGEDSWLSFFRPRNFDILVLDAVLYVPGNDESERTVKINVSDALSSPVCKPCVISCPKPGNTSKAEKQ